MQFHGGPFGGQENATAFGLGWKKTEDATTLTEEDLDHVEVGRRTAAYAYAFTLAPAGSHPHILVVVPSTQH